MPRNPTGISDLLALGQTTTDNDGTQRCLAVHALEVNLSFLEYYVLACLSEHPDHTLRMSQLAAVASSELSRLPHPTRRLETRGLVRRVPDPADGPFTLALPTEAGHELAIKAAPHTRGARAARGVRHRLGSEAGFPTSTRRAIITTPIGHTDPANWRLRSDVSSAAAAITS